MPGWRAARRARSGSIATPRPAAASACATSTSSVVNAMSGVKPASSHCQIRWARQRSQPAIQRCSGVGGQPRLRERDRTGAGRLADQVHRLVEQQPGPGPFLFLLAGGDRRAVPQVPEHQRDIRLPAPQQVQRGLRLGLGQQQLDAGVLGPQPCGRRGHHGGQRRGEPGHADPLLPLPDVRGQFVLCRVQPAQDLLGPPGQQAPRVGQLDAPAGPLHQPGAGLGLQPGEVVADRRLGVIERPGGRGHRAVPGYGGQDPQPGHVQHAAMIGLLDPLAR